MLASSPAAHAAALQQVSNWNGGVALPSDVSMWVYKPDKLAAKPPLLTVIHYCGGSAQAVFGQAQGGGLVSAADKYGFILVVPSNANASGQNGRCWDVTSKKAQTRDGGGDTHAIAQMVKFALAQYQANAARVYCTGDSSGGMTTQLMLALYPDVYKAGSSFAGVPAGCSNAFDGAGLCGFGAQTAQQWGDRVRAMAPGYAGHRPRVQLFHGDADDTIKFPNHGEAIKEWTNVLGLPSSPSMSDASVSLGTHQATRQRWKNECGYVTLDAFTSKGGDHGPSDALFEADYVVPFLGLDSTSEVDPEVQACGSAGGTGGAGAGGASAGGGAGGSAAGSGGAVSAGGSGNVAGTSVGGGTDLGGSTASAGNVGTAGAVTSAGTTSASGNNSAGQAGTPAGGSGQVDAEPAGCGCKVGSRSSGSGALVVLAALGLALGRRRRVRWRALGWGLCCSLMSLGCTEAVTGDVPEQAQGGAAGSAGNAASSAGTTTAGATSAGGPSTAGATQAGGAAGQSSSAGGGGSASLGGTAGQSAGGAAAGMGGTSPGGAGGGGGAAGGASKSGGCDKPTHALKSGAITLQSGGASRKYTLRIPDDYDASRPYRLILGFHGATGNSGQVAPSFFGLWSLSAGSTIFAAPDAVDGLWSNTTDVTFVDDILTQLKGDLCIDTSRIQLEGFSQGGAMAWTLIGARPNVFRAAVVHSGGGLARPATVMPVAFMSSLGKQESSGAGQTSNSDFFAKQNGCTVETLPKAATGGHVCSNYSGCSAGHPTRWCDYDGGHTASPNDAGQNTSWMPQEVWAFLSQF